MGLDPGARKLGFDFGNQIGAIKIIRQINGLRNLPRSRLLFPLKAT